MDGRTCAAIKLPASSLRSKYSLRIELSEYDAAFRWKMGKKWAGFWARAQRIWNHSHTLPSLPLPMMDINMSRDGKEREREREREREARNRRNLYFRSRLDNDPISHTEEMIGYLFCRIGNTIIWAILTSNSQTVFF